MSKVLWASNIFHDASTVFRVSPLPASKNSIEGAEPFLELLARNDARKSLDPGEVPDTLYSKDHQIAPLPPIFQDGFLYLSQELNELLARFDIGDAVFHSFKLKDFQTGRADLGQFFLWNYRSGKTAFLPEQTQNLPAHQFLKHGYLPPAPIQEGDIAVSSDALQGPDIWLDDNLIRTFFVSDRLATSLRDAEMIEAFRLVKCRVI